MPFPKLDEVLHCVKEAKYFASADCLKGYWQVGLTDRASELLAFQGFSSSFLLKRHVAPSEK